MAVLHQNGQITEALRAFEQHREQMLLLTGLKPESNLYLLELSDTLTHIKELQQSLGLSVEAQSTLMAEGKSLPALSKCQPGDDEIRLRLAVNLRELGDKILGSGHPDEAMKSFQELKRLLEPPVKGSMFALLNKSPLLKKLTNPSETNLFRRRKGLADLEISFGNLQESRGHRNAAIRRYEAAKIS